MKRPHNHHNQAIASYPQLSRRSHSIQNKQAIAPSYSEPTGDRSLQLSLAGDRELKLQKGDSLAPSLSVFTDFC